MNIFSSELKTMNGIGAIVIRQVPRALVLSAIGFLAARPALAEVAPAEGLDLASAARPLKLETSPILTDAKLPAPPALDGRLIERLGLTLSLSTELLLGPKARVAAAVGTAGGRDPSAVAVGDFDGDGQLDLAVTNHDGSSVSILLDSREPDAVATDAHYRLAASQAVGAQPQAVVAGDFNGDGLLDLATANAGGGSVTILIADGTARGDVHFSALEVPVDPFGPIAIVAADFNGDGRLDLATANYLGNSVSILLNDTADGATVARFSVAAHLIVGMDGPYALAVGDFNDDGQPDLATANSYGNSVAILVNETLPGSSELHFGLSASPAVGQGPIAIAVGDFNGDHKPDLVTANHYDDSLSILLNDTAADVAGASFRAAERLRVGINCGLTAVAAVDFNGDGKPDLVTTNDGSDSLSILGNDTSPGAAAVRFSVVASPAVSGNLYALAIGDFNRDGKPDLAVTSGGGPDDSTVSILSNDTPARLLLQRRTLQARGDDRLLKP